MGLIVLCGKTIWRGDFWNVLTIVSLSEMKAEAAKHIALKDSGGSLFFNDSLDQVLSLG